MSRDVGPIYGPKNVPRCPYLVGSGRLNRFDQNIGTRGHCTEPTMRCFPCIIKPETLDNTRSPKLMRPVHRCERASDRSTSTRSHTEVTAHVPPQQNVWGKWRNNHWWILNVKNYAGCRAVSKEGLGSRSTASGTSIWFWSPTWQAQGISWGRA